MSFLDQWRAQIPSAVSQMLSQFTQETIVSCEMTATATLWPIRQQIKNSDAEAIEAIGHIIPSQHGTILRLVASWPETILDAIEMTREAARDTDTLAALITIIRFFQTDAVFIQQFQITPSQSVFYGEVKTALLSTGTLTIGQVHLHIAAPEKEPLPPPTIHGPQAHFIGRDKEVEELVSLLETSGETGNTVVIRNDLTASIATVTGLGGVGKTELSRAVANRVQETFPDGQILINLYGSRTTPLPVTQALQEILYAFLGESKLPEQQGELELLYRRVLSNKRVLIVADDARDAAHVKALMLPQGSALLITSRYRFGLPGMHLVELKRLAEPDAIRLLQKINPEIDNEQANTLAQLCGNLPLALRAAAGILKRGKPIESYIHLVRNEKEQIRRLSDKRSDLDVEAVLSSSYSLLTSDEKVVLQQLGVFAASFDHHACEAVVACEAEDPIDLIVDELRDTNLVEYDPETNRYSLHELVRVFALNLLEAKQKEEAYLRYVRYAIDVAGYTEQLFLAGEQLQALALFDRERGHIDESRRWLHQHEISETTDQFIIADANTTADIGSLRYLNASSTNFPYLSRINQLQRALEASQRQKNHQGKATSLANLGSAYLDLGEVHKAIDFYQESLTIEREIHNRRGEAASLSNLGNAYVNLGEVYKAIDFYQQSLTIEREIHDRRGEAGSLGNLGSAYARLGEVHEAIGFFLQQLVIVREIHDRRGEATSLGNLGSAYLELGEVHKGIDFYQQSLEIDREIHDRRGEATSLGNLGIAYVNLGEVHKGIDFYQQQLVIVREIHYPRGEASSLGYLGNAYLELGEVHKAIDFYQQALEIERKIHNRRGEATSLGNLGSAYARLGEVHKAIDFYQQALEIKREIHDRRGEADTHWNFGITLIQQNDTLQGLSELRQGLDFYQGRNHPKAAGKAAIIEYIQVHGKLPIQEKSPIEQQIAMVLAQAEQAVEQALANPQIDRRVLAQQLEEAARQYEAQGADSPYYALAAQFRALIERLDLANYTPPTPEEQIATILANAEEAVEQALTNPQIDRTALAQQLEGAAQHFEAQGSDSTYYPLATQLRTLAAKLIESEEQEQLNEMLQRAATQVQVALTQNDCEACAALYEKLTAVADAYAGGGHVLQIHAVFAANLRELAAKLHSPPTV